MINVFVKDGFVDPWEPYLHEWGGADANDIVIRTYTDLADMDVMPAGVVIFSDIERLTDHDRALASAVEHTLRDHHVDIEILNGPQTTLRRYDLLSQLYARGLNTFRAYRLTDTTVPSTFPVFLRYENDHTGATSGLLFDQAELDRAIVRARIRRHDLTKLIIVEFVDTSDADGLFVKYAAFKVGDTILARHAYFGYEWLLKAKGSINTPEVKERDLSFVKGNPHEAALRERFDIGAVGYGRIDYSILDGEIVTWEINTNPIIIAASAISDPSVNERQGIFVPTMHAAFSDIQRASAGLGPVSLDAVDESLRAPVRRRQQPQTSRVQRMARRYKRVLDPAVRVAEFASIPFEQQLLASWKRSHATNPSRQLVRYGR
ncbi:MAG: hypothetical protein GWP18_04195 [Proteobacteria bacterium]|nr:hypothetical protein [Pseudomonadota bacterium]